jgi:hypothetical protein
VTESAEVVWREPARAAEFAGGLLVAHDWMPLFWTVFRSMVRKIGFSTIKPMMITVNRPAASGGASC